ncbi:SEC14-like protein 4 isoform X1 [Folsomia candida]|uniref:SEC14-like protein 4 isoform X1 n=1 Tax=Folsomia candida TaxID=158441 RepID=UPI000B8FA451|nr:SEC14-like protein 4 isoform X1 [Folsomia candida]
MGSFVAAFLVLLSISCWDKGIVEASVAGEKDLSLSTGEKHALDKFKTLMEAVLFDDRLKKEAYLVRWLRASRFDIKKAEKMLLENLRWRDEFQMDTIHDEDWSEFQERFPYEVSFDKEFQPVITSHMGQWDFRQVILAGKRHQMLRYIFKMLDDIDRAIQRQQDEGKMVTRGSHVSNLKGYNLRQHSCVQCIPLYLEMIQALDSYYPALYDKMVLVNVPSVFEAMLNIMKQAMTPDTGKRIQVFGTSQQKWQNYLLEWIDRDELPVDFGGNKITRSTNDF